METLVRSPKLLSDYRQQFIPNKVLESFDECKAELYNDFSEKPSINWNCYNDYEKIVAYLYELKRNYPHLVKVINIGKTAENRSLLVIRISRPESKTYDRIFIEGGLHANEWISPNAILAFIDRLVKEWDSLPHFMTIKRWLILPLANPDGYVFARQCKENRMWRKNRQCYKMNCNEKIARDISKSKCIGVDLNRNFSIGWDKNKINCDPCSSNYKGISPFSEKETKAIRDFLIPQKGYLKAYIAFHSYGQEIRYLWSYNAPIEEKEKIVNVAKEAVFKINRTTGSKKCKYKLLDNPIDCLFGLGRDWARKELNIRYSFTVELRDKGQRGYKLKPRFICKTGTDIFSFMEVIARAIYNDYIIKKKNFFITQDFYELLRKRTHLYKRPKVLGGK